MRFSEIHLNSFGHFSGEVLRFERSGQGKTDLQIIFGDNEAGKSTTLEAIARLLCGFPWGDESYAFLHARTKLKVGAVLQRDNDGEVAVHRTRSGNALLTADGKTQLPKTYFEDIFGTMSGPLYWQLFGLNQEKLRRGGRELVRGKGDFSRIVFGESLGDLEAFDSVRKGLMEEATALFKHGGKNAKSPLNQIRAERDRIDSEIARTMTTREHWLELTGDSQRLMNEIKELESREENLKNQLKRLERLEASRQPIAELDRLNAAMDPFRDLPDLPDRLDIEFATLNETWKSNSDDLANTEYRIRTLESEIESTRIEEALLSQGEKIAGLAREAPVVEDLRTSFGKRQAELESAVSELAIRIDSLGFDSATPDRLPAVNLPELRIIEGVKSCFLELVAKKAEIERKISETKGQLDQANESIKDLPLVTGTARYDEALRRIMVLLPEILSLKSLRDRLSTSENERERLLSALPHWSGSWSDFESLELPNFEIVSSHSRMAEKAWQERESAGNQLGEIETTLNEKQALLKSRQENSEIPSLEQLVEVRIRRDERWTEIRSRWQSGKMSASADSDLAKSFEDLVHHSDRLADLLREHLETVELMLQCRDLEIRRTVREEAFRKRCEQWNIIRGKWLAHFRFLHSKPEHPDEMTVWPDAVNSIRQATFDISKIGSEVDRIEKEWARCLDEMVLPLIEANTAADLPIEAYREKLQNLRDKELSASENRNLLEKQAHNCEFAIQKLEPRLSEVIGQIDRTTNEWAILLENSALPSHLTPSGFDEFISELNSCRQEFLRVSRQSTKFNHDRQRVSEFETAVMDIVNEIPFSTVHVDPVRIVEDIFSTLMEQRNRVSFLQDRKRSLAIENTHQTEYKNRLDETRSKLEEICRKVGVDNPDEATERITMLARRKQIRSEIDNKEGVLKTLCQGEGYDDWIAEVREIEFRDMKEMKLELAEEIARVNGDLLARREKQYGIKAELKKAETGDDNSTVLVAEQARKTFVETTCNEMEKYVKCVLTNSVLKDASEAYRRRMGDQVLELASSNFHDLSLGGFDRIVIVPDEDSVRSLFVTSSTDDAMLELDQLSEGTQDQLFLALKLAMIQTRLIERRSRGLESLPMIFDDVLVQFDDDRASAAFKLFAELSRTTQVIYLTHHRHLEDVARSTLGDGAFFANHLVTKAFRYGSGKRNKEISKNSTKA